MTASMAAPATMFSTPAAAMIMSKPDYGNDTIYCGPGTNQIDGGPGTDTAVFAGNYADYGRSFANGVTTVVGIEGTSSLANIENDPVQ